MNRSELKKAIPRQQLNMIGCTVTELDKRKEYWYRKKQYADLNSVRTGTKPYYKVISKLEIIAE